jgi:organic hydroperoxide reductase OsmC/OhrA
MRQHFAQWLGEIGNPCSIVGVDMKISARVQNSEGHHQVTLNTNGAAHTVTIAPKATGFGSIANGGELLFLALATCYCNDIYREADKRELTCLK